MGTPVSIRGQTYTVPVPGDVDFGPNLYALLIALAASPNFVFVNVKDPTYGAKGDGVTDDTAALQRAFAALSGNLSTGVGAIAGILYFPLGTYVVKSTLNYVGSSVASILIRGEGKGQSASRLLWEGASGGTMVELEGITRSYCQDMCFDGNSIAKYPIHLQYNAAAGTGTQDVTFSDCQFQFSQLVDGSGNIGVGDPGTGTNGHQCDGINFYNCYFSGGQAGFITTNGANTKNFRFHGCYFVSPNGNAVDARYITGNLGLFGCSFQNISSPTSARCVYAAGNSGNVSIIGCECEGTGMLLGGGLGGNPSGATVQDTFVNMALPTAAQQPANAVDDIGINFSGNVTLRNNQFTNQRTGSSVFMVEANHPAAWGGGNPYSTLESVGNFYCNATGPGGGAPNYGVAPIWDGSGNLVTQQFHGSPMVQRVSSQFDFGGAVNALTDLTPVTANAVQSVPLQAQSYPPVPATGISYLTSGEPRESIHKVTITWQHAAFKAASASAVINAFLMNAKTSVVDVVCDTTVPFAGPSGTIAIAVGIQGGGGNDYVLSHDVKTAAITKGIANGDLGSLLASGARPAGAVMSWSSALNITLTLTSGTGNLGTGSATNLNAGSVTLYITTRSLY